MVSVADRSRRLAANQSQIPRVEGNDGAPYRRTPEEPDKRGLECVWHRKEMGPVVERVVVPDGIDADIGESGSLEERAHG